MWTAIKGEYYLSIEARDTISNLTSKHDITFNVNATASGPIIKPNNVTLTKPALSFQFLE